MLYAERRLTVEPVCRRTSLLWYPVQGDDSYDDEYNINLIYFIIVSCSAVQRWENHSLTLLSILPV